MAQQVCTFHSNRSFPRQSEACVTEAFEGIRPAGFASWLSNSSRVFMDSNLVWCPRPLEVRAAVMAEMGNLYEPFIPSHHRV